MTVTPYLIMNSVNFLEYYSELIMASLGKNIPRVNLLFIP